MGPVESLVGELENSMGRATKFRPKATSRRWSFDYGATA